MTKKPYNWVNEQARLWASLVPAQGQASTLQGELIRIVGKLTDQAYRNGNMNWDDEHERMWRFVGRQLDDADVFSNEERSQIRESIEKIVREHINPDLSGHGSCYYLLCERVVDWCMKHPQPIPHKADRSLRR